MNTLRTRPLRELHNTQPNLHSLQTLTSTRVPPEQLTTLLVRHSTAQGVPPSAFSALSALVPGVHAGGALEPLCEQALRVLDDFAAGSASPQKKRRAFWKRG